MIPVDFTMHEETINGFSTQGRMPDSVVLADDLQMVVLNMIKNIQIVPMVVGGSPVYQE